MSIERQSRVTKIYPEVALLGAMPMLNRQKRVLLEST